MRSIHWHEGRQGVKVRSISSTVIPMRHITPLLYLYSWYVNCIVFARNFLIPFLLPRFLYSALPLSLSFIADPLIINIAFRKSFTCYNCIKDFSTQQMTFITDNEDIIEPKIARTKRDELNLPPLQFGYNSRLGLNCNCLISNEIQPIPVRMS